jgi:hypothetical protein
VPRPFVDLDHASEPPRFPLARRTNAAEPLSGAVVDDAGSANDWRAATSESHDPECYRLSAGPRKSQTSPYSLQSRAGLQGKLA